VAGLGCARIASDAVLAVFNNDELQQTNVHCVRADLRLRLPGSLRLVRDTRFQKKLDAAAPSTAGSSLRMTPCRSARASP